MLWQILLNNAMRGHQVTEMDEHIKLTSIRIEPP